MMASVSMTVGDRAAVWDGDVAYAPRRCRSGGDCDDGDACSVDACVEVRSAGGRGWGGLEMGGGAAGVALCRSLFYSK